MTALREHGDRAMTTKSLKTTKPVDETVATDATDSADTSAAKTKPAKSPTTTRRPRQRPPVADGAARGERKARTDTKQAKLIAMLEAKDGATVEEMAAAFAWQAHTV